MEFDVSWLLLGFPAAFALGWIASRLDIRQLRIENRQAPKAYFRGLNYLLNEQQDQAIDAFIEAVRNDPDTSELHFALGNLFRRRGEYERAVRVHEHLLSRGDLSGKDRHRAQHALALDFLKAGLLDRAEEALRKLEGTEYESQAHLALLSIHERTRDWSGASEIARKLDASGEGSFNLRLAHYLCEQAQQASPSEAERLVREAMAAAPGAARPAMDLAALQQRGGDAQAAVDTLASLAARNPPATGLLASMLADSARTCGRAEPARQLLRAHYEASPSLNVLEALASLEDDAQEARGLYARHLEREPSLVAASRWMAGGSPDPLAPPLQRALEHAARPLTRYRCVACGFEANRHFWQCPGCQTWDSYPPRRVEEL